MPFQIIRDDITRVRADCVVNAANTSLLGGGGVDGAIHMAAGPELQEECRALNGCPVGEVRLTKGYRLPARYIIHTVGPVWRGGLHGEKRLLTACYEKALALADEKGLESIAFPLISSGAYGYPVTRALDVAVSAITRFLEDHEMTVYLVLYFGESFEPATSLYRAIRPLVDDRPNTEKRLRVQKQRREAYLSDESEGLKADMALMAPMASEACDLPMYDASLAPDLSSGINGQSELDDLLAHLDEGFSGMLLRLIDEKGMTDAMCYKKANIDRRLFSKIRSDPAYRPSKATAVAFAVALRLDLAQTEELLGKAGYALNRSSKFDVIIRYCIEHRCYNIFEINEVLFKYDMPLLCG